ncbi:hemolysin family protein [Massilia sp. P8910]|uniref:HlyC/CorC family transporter n=1 Tax=Massilia antarctica TaxID=2765360 RepID=A0AA48WI58_9BURK|nr:hemolysin family protein [Massilia antarctica]MCE3603427.1 hemolysin family protein [Massilia antarctica]QPI52461.1 HlyC/CorC family transporter [Massilia antarctica]
MQNALLVVLALFLVALNGFFVAAEFGIVTLRKTRVRAIAKSQGLRGRLLGKVHGQLDAYLSACQLGITLASLGLGWVGEPAFASLLEPVFGLVGVTSAKIIHTVSFMIAFSVISFLHIVVGELAPKSLAIRNPEVVGLWTAPALYIFYWSMYPAIYLLNGSANLVLRLAGLSGPGGHDAHYSTDELKLILRTSQPGEKFTRDERHILAQSLDFSQLSVADLMRPINEVIALHASKSLEDNLQTVVRNRFSRYPYFDANGEDVLGVIHLKDLFFAQQAGRPIKDLTQFLRPVETMSARTPAQQMFRRFRDGAPHFALIGEKGKRPVGFITLDNLLGAMVGEIRDEFRLNENDWLRQPDGTLIGKASLPIFSLERILGIDIDNETLGLDEVESVGGLLMVKLGDIPKQGQRIEFPHFDIVVKKMNGPRIVLIKVIPQIERTLDTDEQD